MPQIKWSQVTREERFFTSMLFNCLRHTKREPVLRETVFEKGTT